jgi:glycosyltransferase involved in cell wall biosynthesis
VAVINHSDIHGGAARAAYRIHHALRCQGVDSQMYVNEAKADDWTVTGPQGNWNKGFNLVRSSLGYLFTKTLKTDNTSMHSPSIFPSRWPSRINKLDVDVLHLHWINKETLSIADIGRFKKPIVWTLHDMWPFCGAEHYTENFRWSEGYTRHNRPAYESGFDLNQWVWHRKRRYWHHPLQLVTPSRWLAECVHESMLFCNWPVTVIPNCIDTELWQPIDKEQARKLLHLPADIPLLLFGAMNGGRDPRKGFDLLLKALNHLRGQVQGLELIVFGQLPPKNPLDLGFPVHYTGHLHDDISLRLLFSAADLMVIPSRLDNLPNTGVEALACGLPVVSFNVCGLPDIVVHHKTGYLAKAFDAEDFARGIQWVFSDSERYKKLCANARLDAATRFSYAVVGKMYKALYENVLASSH